MSGIAWVTGPVGPVRRACKALARQTLADRAVVPLPHPAPDFHADDVVIWIEPGPPARRFAEQHPGSRFLFIPGRGTGLLNVRDCSNLEEAARLLRAWDAPQPTPSSSRKLVPTEESAAVPCPRCGRETRTDTGSRRPAHSCMRDCTEPTVVGRRSGSGQLVVSLPEDVRVRSHLFRAGTHVLGDAGWVKALLAELKRRFRLELHRGTASDEADLHPDQHVLPPGS